MNMKTIFLSLALMLSMAIHAAQPDTVKVRYIHLLTEDDARIFERNLPKPVIYVNDQVTTHLHRQARRQPVRRQHCPSEAQVHADGQ